MATALPLTIEELRRKALEYAQQAETLRGQEPDLTAFQDYARQRGETGQSAMLNALAAQYAGESFQPLQAQFLKKSAAAYEPTKVGNVMMTPEGKVLRDPFASRDKQIESLLGLGEKYDKQAGDLERAQLAADERAARASQGRGGYYTPLPTANGYMRFNNRDGQIEPLIGPDGRPVVGAQYDPTLQGQLAGAKTTGTNAANLQGDANKAIVKADSLIGLINEAEGLLKQGPTQSGFGGMLDAAGRLVGSTSAGAKLQSQLELISGWMVSNVPRMEGPQSNFDVENYKTMAAKVGANIPIAERLDALQTLRKLQNKYKHLNQEVAGKTTAPAGVSPYADPGKEARYQQWLLQQQGK